jgi:REP element-mobilizing transposase RayT
VDDEPKHLRRLERVFSRSPVFFITATTAFRNPVLANPEFHAICKEVWERSERIQHWSVGPYVIMPDHVHFLCRECSEGAVSLSNFVGKWKEWTSKFAHRRLGFTIPIWQAEFFDHVVRSEESLGKKADYLWHNPVRAGLVGDAADWPYRGNPGGW